MKKTIYIQWMHCASCEMTIKKASESINGIKVEHISSRTWTLRIEIDEEKKLPLLHTHICDCWYQVIQNEKDIVKEKINNKQLLISILIVSILVFVFYKLDFSQYLPSLSGKLSLRVAILMGIIASVSTCLAIVGSVVIGFSEYADKSKWIRQHIKTQILFQVWRIGWFFILGWLLGLLWQTIAISLTTTTILTIIVGVVVLWMWLHLLKIVPNITTLGIHLPKKRSEKTLTTKNPVFAPLIGVLTFFLPCGFTLSMQLIAMNTGNFREWWLAMMLFAIGTLPVLFSLWIWSSYIKDKKFKLLHTIIWILIIFFGIFTIMNGRRLLWWFSSTSNNQNISSITAEYEQIEIGHNWLNLVPEIITLTAGRDYELTITPSDNGKWCMNSLVIPWFDRTVHQIIKDIPIIYKIHNIKKGTYYVVCWTMGMYQWKIIVQQKI